MLGSRAERDDDPPRGFRPILEARADDDEISLGDEPGGCKIRLERGPHGGRDVAGEKECEGGPVHDALA